MAESQHLAAVREHLVDGEVEPLVALLHLRAVERAAAAVDAHPAAGRADPRRVLDALVEEQALDPGIRSGLERLLPAGRRTRVAADLLLPALDTLGLLLLAPLLEHGYGRAEQFDRGGLGLRRRPADDRVPGVTRQKLRELALHLLRTDDDDARIAEPAQLPRELVRPPLDARLRPAPLVVPARLLLEQVGDLVQASCAQAVEAALLARNDGDYRALSAADKRHERGQVELASDLELVRH